jgi:hypothetical protein
MFIIHIPDTQKYRIKIYNRITLITKISNRKQYVVRITDENI